MRAAGGSCRGDLEVLATAASPKDVPDDARSRSPLQWAALEAAVFEVMLASSTTTMAESLP